MILAGCPPEPPKLVQSFALEFQESVGFRQQGGPFIRFDWRYPIGVWIPGWSLGDRGYESSVVLLVGQDVLDDESHPRIFGCFGHQSIRVGQRGFARLAIPQ